MKTVFILFFFLSSTAAAQNLISNPEFDDGWANWSVHSSGVMEMAEGSPTPPSAELLATPFNEAPVDALASSCIPVDSGKLYVLSANLKFVQGTGSMDVGTSTSSDCSFLSPKFLEVAYSPISNGWQSASVSGFSFDDSMKFAIVFFACPGNGCTMLIDHVDFRVQQSTSVSLQTFGID